MMAVGLDAGFDGGAAAWVLDLVGCAATARSEEAALGAVPGRIRSHATWSGENAETTVFEVVERVETRVLQDGYEVNATFAADHEPMTPDAIVVAQRRLATAHQRLIDAAYAMPGSSLRGEGTSDEEMLRHVIRAAIWLSTRTEPDQRAISFPAEDAEMALRVRDGLGFVDWYVGRLGDGDGIRHRVDSKGEEWTVRKVLRRLIYHAIDHAEQLERGEVRT
jgi:hypothetical protein